MASGSPPTPSPQHQAVVTLPAGDSNPTVENHTEPKPTSNATIIKKKMKKKKMQKSDNEVSSNPLKSSSSSSCTTSYPNTRSKGIRLSSNRRNPRIPSSPFPQKPHDIDALALPLGMSIAAFVSQVLERKEAAGRKMSVDHLSQICTLAVQESLANAYGDKFGCFASNFGRSFKSTLTTLRVINESSETNVEKPRLVNEERSYLSKPLLRSREGSSTCNSVIDDCHFETKESNCTCEEQTSALGVDEENMHTNPVSHEPAVHDGQNSQQLVCVPSNTPHSGVNLSMLSTLERSVSEQTRSNDLKAFEISLLMKKMKLKEAQIAVNCDSNFLERFKLSMGISKANFRAEKFKTELEDSRHAELLKKCIDCLVAGLLIMLASLAYGTYVYSHQRLIEATESCTHIKESKSWWIPNPMASFSSGFQVLRCQVQVISRMLFGVLMIVAITFLLIQRSGSTKQTMPVTFILLLLGVGCGFAGKFCIDTLGGSGNRWLLYWEILCLVHLLSNICTSVLFLILHGPVTVTGTPSTSKLFPYWTRRFLFYANMLLILPLLCGFMPFAGPEEWTEHFSMMIKTRLLEESE